MASAAAAKKWPRPSNPGLRSPTSRRYASWTRAVGWRVWPGALGRQPGGGELPQLVVDEREQVGGGRRSPAAAASSRRVTSDMWTKILGRRPTRNYDSFAPPLS